MDRIRVYVAGKWQDRTKIRLWYALLKELGYEITCDWTAHEYPGEDEANLLEEYAVADIEGVQDCDLLLAVFEEDLHYRGALVEMGAALALKKPVWILGHSQDSCIFTNHPLVCTFGDVDRLVSALKLGRTGEANEARGL